jgi:N-acetylglucosamine-6-sulfatase
VRTDRWKYIHYPHGDCGPDRHTAELYDLRDDPLEMHNLISAPAHAQRVRELKAMLEQLMRKHHALPDNPPLDKGIQTTLPKY